MQGVRRTVAPEGGGCRGWGLAALVGEQTEGVAPCEAGGRPSARRGVAGACGTGLWEGQGRVRGWGAAW